MSENLKRSNPDFSKYDSMSIGELEEILRADAQGPERDDSDVDEILYVMEVLAKKRRQNGIAGKTAFEAYQEFQQHYLPMVEEESVPKHKSNIIPFRRIAAVAASLVLIFTLATSANAFSFKAIWNAVERWAEETFFFSVGVETTEPVREDNLTYSSLQEALKQNERDSTIVPTWIPEGFSLMDIRIERSPAQESIIAIYLNGDDVLRIAVQTYLIDSPERIEISEGAIEECTLSGIKYYLMSNNSINQAVWIVNAYECYIAGDISVAEIKCMIDSIEKGE